MRIAIDELVHVGDCHAAIEHAGNRARGVARRRNAAADGEIALTPSSRSEDAGEIPALHLLVEHHAYSVRQLRVEERTQQPYWWTGRCCAIRVSV